MEIKEMSIEQLEERKAAIANEVDAPEADLDALESEVRAINEELETRKNAEAKKVEIRSAVAKGQGEVIKKIEVEEKKKMTNEEVRSSKEYVDAFANYIKSGDDTECRALLTENVSGQLPVPTVTEGRIRTAWDRTGLMDLVRRTYVRGNLRIGFELSATGAVVHTEGAAAPAEETLTFGVVNLIPKSIKKWISISDEAMDLGGQEFLDYIYDELTYRIAKEASRLLIAAIVDAPAASSATAVGVASIAGTSSDLAVARKAAANLSDEAGNITVVMNKLTHADFIEAMAGNGYRFDPFEGLNVRYDNSLPAYSAASTGDTWMIVGDFGVGAQANFPNGETITIKVNDTGRAKEDLVEFIGREYVAIGVVAPGAFVKVTKAAEG